MLRNAVLGLLACLASFSCGPDQRECSGPHADFIVILKLANRPLPPDTVVHVTYGGSGMEEYALAAQGQRHEVVFCDPADENGMPLEASVAAAGATGDDGDSLVRSLRCKLWTGGFSKIEVRGTGVDGAVHDLSPREHVCTVEELIDLDSPDAS